MAALVFTGTEEEVRREHRKVVEVQGREVVVFAIRDTYYALDRQCYREFTSHSQRPRAIPRRLQLIPMEFFLNVKGL